MKQQKQIKPKKDPLQIQKEAVGKYASPSCLKLAAANVQNLPKPNSSSFALPINSHAKLEDDTLTVSKDLLALFKHKATTTVSSRPVVKTAQQLELELCHILRIAPKD